MLLTFEKYGDEVRGCSIDKNELITMLYNALVRKYPKRPLCKFGDNGELEFQMAYIGRHVFTFRIYYKGIQVSDIECNDPTLFFEDSHNDLRDKAEKYVDSICNNLSVGYGVNIVMG